MKLGPVMLNRKLVTILLAATIVLYLLDGLLNWWAGFHGVRFAAHACLGLTSLAALLLWGEWAAYLTALLYVLCFPHAGFGFLGFVCLVPLMLAALHGDRRRAMWLAWLAGTLANVGKLYWIVYTISYFSPIPFAAAVVILLMLTATLGLFWALFFGTVHWAVRRRGMPLWLVFPAGWVFWDWFLTWFLGGFPWDLLGCAAFHVPLFNQTLDLVGEHGLGWLLAFGNVAFYELWLFARKRRTFPLAQTSVLGVLIVASLIYGFVRGGQIERLMQAGKVVRVGMAQGNIDQSVKWKPEFREKVLEDYARLANQIAQQGVDLIIFPETAIPRRQLRWREVHPEIFRYARENKSWFLTGVASAQHLEIPDESGVDISMRNSAVLISPAGEAVSWYDKNRLVPFGEYIPKKHWLEKIASAFGIDEIKGTLNFEPSGEYHLMNYPGAPFSVFICYEAVYPDTVRTLNRLGATFLVTITNDAWFGPTSAPYQHWAQVAMRAIESRRYVARAANTGISGVIDPLGRTIMATDIYVRAQSVGEVRTVNVETVYDRIGDAAAYAAAAIYLAALLWALIVRRKVKEQTS